MTKNQTIWEKSAKMFLSEKMQETLDYLWSRWQDEKEYEDINEYGKAFQKKLPKGYKVVQCTKRPFGFIVKIDALRHIGAAAHVQVKSTGIFIEARIVENVGGR